MVVWPSLGVLLNLATRNTAFFCQLRIVKRTKKLWLLLLTQVESVSATLCDISVSLNAYDAGKVQTLDCACWHFLF